MNLAVKPAGWGRTGRVLLALLLLVMSLVTGLQAVQAQPENLNFSVSHGYETYANYENYEARSSVAGVGTRMEFRFAVDRELTEGDEIRIDVPGGFVIPEDFDGRYVWLYHSKGEDVDAAVSLVRGEGGGGAVTLTLNPGAVVPVGEWITAAFIPYGEPAIYPLTNPWEPGDYEFGITVGTSIGPVTNTALYTVVDMGLTATSTLPDAQNVGYRFDFTAGKTIGTEELRVLFPYDVMLYGFNAEGVSVSVGDQGENLVEAVEPLGSVVDFRLKQEIPEGSVVSVDFAPSTGIRNPITKYELRFGVWLGMGSPVDLTVPIPSSTGGLKLYNYNQPELNPYVNDQNNVVMEFFANGALGENHTIELRYPAEYNWNMTGAAYQISVNYGENREVTGTHVNGPNGPSIVFQLPAGFVANEGDKVQLFLGLAENPSLGGKYTFSARTSPLESWAHFFTDVNDKSLRGLEVEAGNDKAGARDVAYTFSFDAPFRYQPVLAASSSEESEAFASESGSDTTVELTFPPGYAMNAEQSPADVSVKLTGPEGDMVIEPNRTAVYYGEGGERIVEVDIPSWEMPPLTPVEITLKASAGIVNPAAGGAYALKAQMAGDMESAAYEIFLREAGEEPVDTTILSVKESETSEPLSVSGAEYSLQVPYTTSGPVKVLVELNDARAVLTAAADEGTVAGVTYGRPSEAGGYYVQFDGLGEGLNTARVVVSGAGAEPHGYLIVIHRAARPSTVPLNGTPYPITAAHPVAVFAEGAVTLDFTGSTFSAGAYVKAWEEPSPAYSPGMKPVSSVVRFEIFGVTTAAGQPVKLAFKTTSGNANKPVGVFVSNGSGWVHDRSGLVSEGRAELLLSGLPAGDYGVFEADYTTVKMRLGKPAGGARELTLTSEEGAAIYYQIDGQGYQPYNAARKPLVKAGEKVTAYAKAAGRLESEPRELTVPHIPVIGKAEDVLKELKNGQDFNGDGTFDGGDVVDYLNLIEPYRAKP